ncbi:hypothetical protein MTO96_032756 [Rhipicephalus appendiculatus]
MSGTRPIGPCVQPVTPQHVPSSEKTNATPKVTEVRPTGRHMPPGSKHPPPPTASKEPQQPGRTQRTGPNVHPDEAQHVPSSDAIDVAPKMSEVSPTRPDTPPVGGQHPPPPETSKEPQQPGGTERIGRNVHTDEPQHVPSSGVINVTPKTGQVSATSPDTPSVVGQHPPPPAASDEPQQLDGTQPIGPDAHPVKAQHVPSTGIATVTPKMSRVTPARSDMAPVAGQHPLPPAFTNEPLHSCGMPPVRRLSSWLLDPSISSFQKVPAFPLKLAMCDR